MLTPEIPPEIHPHCRRDGLVLVNMFYKIATGGRLDFLIWTSADEALRVTYRKAQQLFYKLGLILTARVPILVAVGMLGRESSSIAAGKFLGELEAGLKLAGSLYVLLIITNLGVANG